MGLLLHPLISFDLRIGLPSRLSYEKPGTNYGRALDFLVYVCVTANISLWPSITARALRRHRGAVYIAEDRLIHRGPSEWKSESWHISIHTQMVSPETVRQRKNIHRFRYVYICVCVCIHVQMSSRRSSCFVRYRITNLIYPEDYNIFSALILTDPVLQEHTLWLK